MERVENSVSKDLYKVFLLILRGIPYIIAICYVVFTAAFYFGLELNVIGYIGSCSIMTWIFLYVSSFVFKFCKYHKVKEDTEQAAYLIGYIIQKMHRVFRYMISTGTV